MLDPKHVGDCELDTYAGDCECRGFCGAICPCAPIPPAWYAGECTLPYGHDGLHSASGYCYYDNDGNKVNK